MLSEENLLLAERDQLFEAVNAVPEKDGREKYLVVRLFTLLSL